MPGLSQAIIDLTRTLIAFDTVNPPGQEIQSIEFCASWLRDVGFECTVHRHSLGRGNLIATRGTGAGLLPLCFSGHLDTVPLGETPWRWPPFEGRIEGDRLVGRGSSDMKGAIAAFMVACRETPSVRGGVTILLTAGEETGCEGARGLAEANLLPEAGAMVVGESTENRPLAGHKGTYWLKLTTSGRTAHGATPALGENAILKAAPLLHRLADFDLDVSHPVMGEATWNLGTMHAGLNTNSVPDRCEMTLDVRTVAGLSHAEVYRKVEELAGANVKIEVLLDLPPVWSDPAQVWFAQAARAVSQITGMVFKPAVASYFTDASILKPAMKDLPVMILGPGSLDQPHSTDEHVLISRLVEAFHIYSALLSEWNSNGLVSPAI